MYSAITKKSRQRRMLDFYNLDLSKYILIGRSSAWPNELIPPIPTGDETELEELIGGKLVQNEWFVRMINNPTEEERESALYYKGNYYYRTVDPAEAIVNDCTSIILYVALDRDELPLTTFRQVGLQVKVAHSSSTVTASQFSSLTDKGQLEVIENRKPQTRSDDQMEEILVKVDF